MEKEMLIAFNVGEKYSLDYLRLFLWYDFIIDEAVENGYFEKSGGDTFIFTEKGYKFAWGKE